MTDECVSVVGLWPNFRELSEHGMCFNTLLGGTQFGVTTFLWHPYIQKFQFILWSKRVHSSTHQGGMKSWIFISWKPAALERVRWWAQCALRRFTKVFCRVDPPNQDLTLCCGLSEPFSSSPLLLVKHFVFRDIYKKSFWDICNSAFHVSAQSWFFNAGYLMHTKNQCNIHNVCYSGKT